MSGTAPTSHSAAQRYQLSRRFCRECALRGLYQLDIGEDWSLTDEQFDILWQQVEEAGLIPPVGERKAALRKEARKLLDGVLEQRANLDRLISAVSANWSLQRMNIVDRNVLRLGLYEMLYREKVPQAVAINEAIELAREYGDKDSPAFVNGLLDRCLTREEPA